MTIKTTLDMDQSVIFYDPNNCKILPGIISGVSFFQSSKEAPPKEAYYIKPSFATFSTGPIPLDFIFNDKDSVLDFCVKLMKDIEEL